ncbi:MAG: response regulator receiver protein [uncultured bacterium]|nr:MAG: response regulator receiver protein [uncultured bacterium]
MKQKEILLIEDSLADIRLMAELLVENKEYYNLNVVETGTQAIDFLNKKGNYKTAPRPDIIILDLNLPQTDGHQILKFVKNRDSFKTIPVIVLTNSTSKDDIDKAYASNANCYIAKPTDLNEFISVIDSIESFWLEKAVLPNNPKISI